MPQLTFTVDSALLRELGERLVGKPHIALAELVKNAYDADATEVVIKFGDDILTVEDNGHGMTESEFESFWMRIGSPHKEKLRTSRELGRPLTGSKGVGRLAAQFLARELELITATGPEDLGLAATVDWTRAIAAGDLTNAAVDYVTFDRPEDFIGGSAHGTRLVLKGLNQTWSADRFEDLAREIWSLQPPFGSGSADSAAFAVRLEAVDPEAVSRFDAQMGAILELWHARIVGVQVTHAEARTGSNVFRVSLEFDDRSKRQADFRIPDSHLAQVRFEIRVFSLRSRQPHGIRVDEARSYLNRYGGVHVYDSGFHLPYYGPETDWLRIEIDHSHRLSRSELLPEEFQVVDGLSFLPTNSRLYGVVSIDTGLERAVAEKVGLKDYLAIQVSRDRLVSNEAFGDLRYAVRWAIDFYAVEEARREFLKAERLRDVRPIQDRMDRIDGVLARYEADIPKDVSTAIREEIHAVGAAAESTAEREIVQVGLLGALATAGMTSLAVEHDLSKQWQSLEWIARDLEKLGREHTPLSAPVTGLVTRLREWIELARSAREPIAYLLDEDARVVRRRFAARDTIRAIAVPLKPLLRGMTVGVDDVPQKLLLPPARYADWVAVFQNLLLNAANATLDSDERRVAVSARQDGAKVRLLVEDTGVGVDLNKSE
jgi:signal transduction histidine kinase